MPGGIERTNSRQSNFGQLRRNTDRFVIHRLAQLAPAVALFLTTELIDWRDFMAMMTTPIRSAS